jgi:uncharacterized protein YbbC (DUF1343 family)
MIIQVGLERLLERPPSKARIGLLAHAASVVWQDTTAHHAADLLRAHRFNLIRLFGPEHGLYGQAQAGDTVADSTDATGIPIVSLYGSRRAPEPEHLADLDILIVDLQDVGARCYTYLSTLKACLEICAITATRCVVLDRPNPLGRLQLGPSVSSGFESFVGAHPVPLIHGLTLGELALLMAEALGALEVLEVISMQGWLGQKWQATGLTWTPPSPNLPRTESAELYPATVFFEGTNLSEGRGTTFPFEQFGAPWLNGKALAETVNSQALGVVATPVSFRPSSSKHQDAQVNGIQLSLSDWSKYQPLELAYLILSASYWQNPDAFTWLLGDAHYFIDLLYGSSALREAIVAGISLEAWRAQAETFQLNRPSLYDA